MATGVVKRFKRASRFGLIEPDRGEGSLFVYRASPGESVLATAGERVEFDWRDGGLGREAIDVVASAAAEASCEPRSQDPCISK